MSNPCVANSSEVFAIFNSREQASTQGLRNNFLLRRDEKIVRKRPAAQYNFQPSICYCHKL